jgi:NADPH:quinone reductase-like Zn-dependent oxidoreductase
LAVAPAALTLRRPGSVSWERAAAIPTAGRTAWAALVDRAATAAGDDVLVTAAASGVGSYAVQIARALGARVIATAGSPEKCARARELGAIAALDHYRDDVAAGVQEATEGRGVDVVCDHVGTPIWDAAVGSLAPGGRFVTTGVTAGHLVTLHLGQVFTKGTTITGVGRPEPKDVRRHLEGVLAMVERGEVTPQIAAVFPLEAMADAHRLMERSAFFGKIVLVL